MLKNSVVEDLVDWLQVTGERTNEISEFIMKEPQSSSSQTYPQNYQFTGICFNYSYN